MNELSKLQQTHNQLKKDFGNSNLQCQQLEQSNKALSDDIVAYQNKIQSFQLQRVSIMLNIIIHIGAVFNSFNQFLTSVAFLYPLKTSGFLIIPRGMEVECRLKIG